jgi:predicted lipoprotein with Yx(FWY)xxD motif
MKHTKLLTSAALLGAAAVALVAAGCGGGGGGGGAYGGGSKTNTTATTKPVAATSSTLAVGNTKLGKILVGANGRTLYMFLKDTGPKSTCEGACAGVWPPFTSSGTPKAGSGIDASKLSTSKRTDGKTQVVYAGHPLYYYVSDAKAGDTTGQGLNQFGAEWYVVSPAGKKWEGGGSS